MTFGGRSRIQLEADTLAEALCVLRVRADARRRLRVADFSIAEHRALWRALRTREPEGADYESLGAFVAEVWERPLPDAMRWLLSTSPGVGSSDDVGELVALREVSA